MGFFKDLFNAVTLGVFMDAPDAPPPPKKPAPAPKREKRVGEDDISVGQAEKTRGARARASTRATRTGNFLTALSTAQSDEIGLGL